MSKVVITCALTGVLTDPERHSVPVTPEQMASEAKRAYDAGATVIHVHYRQQGEGMGRFPSWEPEVAVEITDAIRAACPDVVINMTTGVLGPDVSGPLACLKAVKPELAAMNAGSLNYLKATSKGTWAWPPMVFDNPVSKIETMLAAMHEVGAHPEFECFDVGIVRSVGLYRQVGLAEDPLHYNFVMGVASGMPADPALLELLVGYRVGEGGSWQVTAIGREDVWPLHRKAAELGGHLRTGLEDTFYLPDGTKPGSNGPLIEALAATAREAGRDVASPSEARALLGC